MHCDDEETEEEEGAYNRISSVVIAGGVKAVPARAATLFTRAFYIHIWTNLQDLF